MGIITTLAELVAAVLTGLTAILTSYLTWLQIKARKKDKQR